MVPHGAILCRKKKRLRCILAGKAWTVSQFETGLMPQREEEGRGSFSQKHDLPVKLGKGQEDYMFQHFITLTKHMTKLNRK